ncbi:MAG: Hpt domain-containing protein, partial [Lachnospiraceae bacterium]|nr:Hpt domain-containing protein [Lachnospiraceae bacterium]
NIDTPVICLTADAVVGARERYLSKGFNDYLTKPIDSTYLEMMLRKYIPAEKVVIVNEETNVDKGQGQAGFDDAAGSPYSVLEEGGIDTVKGLANCGGDDELYRSILLEYVKGAEEKKGDLEKFLDAGDMKNYGILIHSLKSTSAMIGAEVPRKLALALEAAAKKDDSEFVHKNHAAFLKEYGYVIDAMERVVSADDEMEGFSMDENGVMEFSPDNE